jgi:hypothetical protein
MEIVDRTFKTFFNTVYHYYDDDFGPDQDRVYSEILKYWLMQYRDITTA